MRIPGLKTAKLMGRWLRSRAVGGGVILGYHCVADSALDPYSLCVSPLHFAEQLEVLRKHAYLIRLQELVGAIQVGRIPRRAVALTFDDGYVDTLSTAKPLLERYQIPATVFITTGYIGREFWWDELARLLLTPQTLPESLCLTVNSYAYHWKRSDTARARTKNDSTSTKLYLLRSLYRWLRPLPEPMRQRALEQLGPWTGGTPQGPPLRRALAPEELAQLADGDLIEVGAHTVSHPPLATLSPAMQRSEVLCSKARLEELLAQPVVSFSYPYGSLSTFSIAAVQEAGFASACTSFPDVARVGSDRFQLPRFWVQNWDSGSFARWLGWWLNG
jgi:peptidoglycan/xylan/chitin deacetylase (PgdA/CDA1 family)